MAKQLLPRSGYATLDGGLVTIIVLKRHNRDYPLERLATPDEVQLIKAKGEHKCFATLKLDSNHAYYSTSASYIAYLFVINLWCMLAPCSLSPERLLARQ